MLNATKGFFVNVDSLLTKTKEGIYRYLPKSASLDILRINFYQIIKLNLDYLKNIDGVILILNYLTGEFLANDAVQISKNNIKG